MSLRSLVSLQKIRAEVTFILLIRNTSRGRSGSKQLAARAGRRRGKRTAAAPLCAGMAHFFPVARMEALTNASD